MANPSRIQRLEIEGRESPCDLGGWSVSICPGCGAQVQEWLTYVGPDVIEHERCPMCAEADHEGEVWWE